MTNGRFRKRAAKAKARTEALKLQQQREQRNIKRRILQEEQRLISLEARELCEHWPAWTGAEGKLNYLGYYAARDVIRKKFKAEKLQSASEARVNAARLGAGRVVESRDDRE